MSGMVVCDIKSCPHNGKPTCNPGVSCTKHTVGTVTMVNVKDWSSTEWK